MRKNLLLSTFFCLILFSYSEADVIKLKDGRKIDFPILYETEDRVIIDVKGSNVSLSRRDIEGLEEKPIAEAYRTPPEEINYIVAKETMSLGGAFYDSGRLDDAVRTFKKALVRTQNRRQTASIFFNLSSCYLAKGDYLKSIRYSKKCLTIVPRYWKAMANIATAYLNMNDLEAADYHYAKAEKFADKDSREYWRLKYQRNMVSELAKEA